MAIYMQADGLKGSVTTVGYEGWINLSQFYFSGVTNSLESIVGKQGDRITRRPEFGEIAITKYSDASSIQLFERSYSGEVIANVNIHFLSTGNPPAVYEKWELKNVLISQASIQHTDSARLPIEYINLNYTSIQSTCISRAADHAMGSPVIAGYDLPMAKKM